MPEPLLKQVIDSYHFAELMVLDSQGLIPDEFDKLNVLVNAVLKSGFAGIEKAIDVRPKKKLTEEEKAAKLAATQNMPTQRHTWRT